jgi:hypothetical protein
MLRLRVGAAAGATNICDMGSFRVGGRGPCDLSIIFVLSCGGRPISYHNPVTSRNRGTERNRVSRVLSRIGDKWTVLVIMLLRERSRRFSELKRGSPSG